MSDSDRDSFYMATALRLAARGHGLTSPNPMVGAVVVAGSRIIAKGYHRRAGGPHAEIVALKSAGAGARGAALYVTLEPCSHTAKRTPPCVPAIVASGVRRVVIAMQDPNPRVNGRGIRQLRRAGLDLQVGCLRDRAERLNEAYVHWIRTGRPFVIMKTAMTLDGKIATASGQSQWISGEASRRDAHGLRKRVDAVMVGIGTVLQDDPRLTVRLSPESAQKIADRQPFRVILDSRLRISTEANVLASPSTNRVIIVTTDQASTRRVKELQARHIDVIVVPARNGRVSLMDCLTALGRQGITSVLLEGGSELNAAVLNAGLVNRVRFYIAPMLLGGRDAKGVIGGSSPKRLHDARRLHDIRVDRIGQDLVVEGHIDI